MKDSEYWTMKAAYQALLVVIPIIIVVSAATMLALAPTPVDDDPEPVQPEPVPVIDLPDGITYDASTRTLSSESITQWHVFDDLHAYSENGVIYEGYDSESRSISLSPGKYTVTVNDETFTITVSGKVSRALSWDYILDGNAYKVSVSYEIDIEEYVEINERSKAFNVYTPHMFSELPDLVTVNDTVRGIVSQLEKRFVEIGGSVDDRQGYAEFLASMAQVPIEYPAFKTYGDMKIWGVDEYWQDTMETLYHMAGDCEDKSALACSLFVAAGYDAAMCGVVGHVVAGVAIDGFVERSESELRDFNMDKWVLTADTDITGNDTETVYYGVETIKEEQHYIGYLMSGSAECIGKKTIWWGMSGFYPVSSR